MKRGDAAGQKMVRLLGLKNARGVSDAIEPRAIPGGEGTIIPGDA